MKEISIADVMPIDQFNFINNLSEEMLQSTNMKSEEAYSFAFRVWQSKEFLTKYLLDDTRNDIAYEKGRADAIEEFADTMQLVKLVECEDVPRELIEAIEKQIGICALRVKEKMLKE